MTDSVVYVPKYAYTMENLVQELLGHGPVSVIVRGWQSEWLHTNLLRNDALYTNRFSTGIHLNEFF